MGCTNSPLTMVVPPDEEVVFDLNCTPLGPAQLTFPAGTLEGHVVVTFRCTNEVPPVTGQKVKLVISEGFEIVVPDTVHFNVDDQVLLKLPYDASLVDDPTEVRLYEQETDGDWRHSTAVPVLTNDGSRVDHFILKRIKPDRIYAAAVDKL